MIAWLTVLLLLGFCGALLSVPRSLLQSYRQTFVARHGLGVQVSLVVLSTLTLAMLVTTLVQPGVSGLMESVDALVAILAVTAACCDFYVYAHSAKKQAHSSKKQPRAPKKRRD